jgi:hypothetical protein
MTILDLTELIQRTEGDRRYKPFATEVRILWAAYAARADLDAAKEALDEVYRLTVPPAGRGTTELGTSAMATLSALMNNAILLYCRATHSKSTSGRFAVGVERGMSEELRRNHKLITSLRDKVIAHHGHGDQEMGGPWIKDRITVAISETKATVRYWYLTIGVRSDVRDGLAPLIEHAQKVVVEKAEAGQAKVAFAARDLLQADPHFRSILDACEFHEEVFFGNVEFERIKRLGDRQHMAWFRPGT